MATANSADQRGEVPPRRARHEQQRERGRRRRPWPSRGPARPSRSSSGSGRAASPAPSCRGPSRACGRPGSPASATTSSTLPSSDGWKLKNGSTIQLLAPRVAVAMPSTARIEADHQRRRAGSATRAAASSPAARRTYIRTRPDAGVDRLALDVVVAGRPATSLRRGALERDQRAGDQPERRQQQQRVQPQPPLARDERGRRLGGGLDGRGAHSVALVPGVERRCRLMSNH